MVENGPKKTLGRKKRKRNRGARHSVGATRERIAAQDKQAKSAITERKRRSLAVVKGPEVISRLGEFGFPVLVRLWGRGLELSTSSMMDERQIGERLLSGIQAEWGRRGPIVSGEEFPWPTTDAPGGDGLLALKGLPQTGMLAFMGYRVGRTHGQATSLRRLILDKMFAGGLPQILEPEDMAEWGAAQTPVRLRKLAHSIAGLCRLAKRRNADALADAISDWEADLDYLYHRYYVTMRSFVWPNLAVL